MKNVFVAMFLVLCVGCGNVIGNDDASTWERWTALCALNESDLDNPVQFCSANPPVEPSIHIPGCMLSDRAEYISSLRSCGSLLNATEDIAFSSLQCGEDGSVIAGVSEDFEASYFQLQCCLYGSEYHSDCGE